MNNLEMNRAKKKLKNSILGGGDSMQFERLSMCPNTLSIFKFVKILNHSQVQVLSNKKKNHSFLRLLWAEM